MTREVSPVDWSMVMMNLATVYMFRIRGDKAQNLESAIAYYEQSFLVRERNTMPFDWADSMMGLATVYRERIKGDKAANIERAIDIQKQALQIRTRDAMPLEWTASMAELGNAYLDRIKGDRAQNIEAAIDSYLQALQIVTKENMSVKWATITQNLANAYIDRIEGDRSQNLEKAIDACQQSLQVRTRESLPVEWAQSMLTLGNTYAKRILGDRKNNLEQARKAYQQAREVITKKANPVVWAGLTGNLANVYRTLSESGLSRDREQSSQYIEVSLALYQQSAQVIARADFPVSWSMLMRNIAITYLDRIKGNKSENIEEAIEFQKRSLEVRTQSDMPIEWAESLSSLAGAYSERLKGSNIENVRKAVDYFQKALEIYLPDRLPNDCRRTARLLGDLLCSCQRWNDAVEAYQKGLQATEILYQASLLRSSQEAELAETDDLFRRAAYAQAKAGQLERAVVTVEQGRARGLSDTLEQDRTDLTALEEIAPQAYNQYQEAVLNLRRLERDERSVSDDVIPNGIERIFRTTSDETAMRESSEAVRQQLRAAIDIIREQPGYKRFLMAADWNDVERAIQNNQPLIYLIPTPDGGLAIVVEKDEQEGTQVSSIWLESLTVKVQKQLLYGEKEDWHGWFGSYCYQQSDPDQWRNAIDCITHQLWPTIMGPIVNYLMPKHITKAILVPTSYLSFLPLHAAWTEDSQRPTGRRYVLDDITFSYAPNARSLDVARAIAQRTLADALLAVGEPQLGGNPLHYASQEIDAVTAYFRRNITLKQTNATRESVLSALPHANILHFSCHGTSSFKSPLDSGLLLSNNDLLTLRDVLSVQTQGIRLAVLSACETGVSGTRLPDEVISLPAGLLQAGVAGIAASLWSVADMSTMLLIRRFYDYWQQEGFTLPESLRLAQCWLRDTSSQKKAQYFKQSDPNLYRELILYPADCFAHPYHWAAFTYVGV